MNRNDCKGRVEWEDQMWRGRRTMEENIGEIAKIKVPLKDSMDI